MSLYSAYNHHGRSLFSVYNNHGRSLYSVYNYQEDSCTVFTITTEGTCTVFTITTEGHSTVFTITTEGTCTVFTITREGHCAVCEKLTSCRADTLQSLGWDDRYTTLLSPLPGCSVEYTEIGLIRWKCALKCNWQALLFKHTICMTTND